MFTKQDFLDSVKQEAAILKHLATVVPAGQLDYRPTPTQRSTIELMRYLTIAPLFSARYTVEGKYSEDDWDAQEKKAEAITPKNFGAAMAAQAKGIEKLLAKFDDKKLQKLKGKLWDETSIPLGAALVRMVLKVLVAYRMQLFLYAKASGASHIGTSDCWQGKAAKKAKAS